MENLRITELVELKILDTDSSILLPEDSIILLLFARSDRAIRGRVSIQKELFLMYNEVLNRENFSEIQVLDPEFVPYKYGPYSFKLSSALASLVFRGKIAKNGRKNWEKFTITEDGIELAHSIMNFFPNHIINELIEVLKSKRQGWDQLGREGLMVRTMMLYPKYYEFSKVGSSYSGGLQALKVIERINDRTSLIIIDVLNDVDKESNEYEKVKNAYYDKMDERYRGEAWGKLYAELS